MASDAVEETRIPFEQLAVVFFAAVIPFSDGEPAVELGATEQVAFATDEEFRVGADAVHLDALDDLEEAASGGDRPDDAVVAQFTEVGR